MYLCKMIKLGKVWTELFSNGMKLRTGLIPKSTTYLLKKAQQAFLDSKRIIAKDLEHSEVGERYYCFEKVEDHILTVRFIYREDKIRIIGAGYWRKGKKNL